MRYVVTDKSFVELKIKEFPSSPREKILSMYLSFDCMISASAATMTPKSPAFKRRSFFLLRKTVLVVLNEGISD